MEGGAQPHSVLAVMGIYGKYPSCRGSSWTQLTRERAGVQNSYQALKKLFGLPMSPLGDLAGDGCRWPSQTRSHPTHMSCLLERVQWARGQDQRDTPRQSCWFSAWTSAQPQGSRPESEPSGEGGTVGVSRRKPWVWLGAHGDRLWRQTATAWWLPNSWPHGQGSTGLAGVLTHVSRRWVAKEYGAGPRYLMELHLG